MARAEGKSEKKEEEEATDWQQAMNLLSIGKESFRTALGGGRKSVLLVPDHEEEDSVDIAKCEIRSGHSHLALVTGSCTSSSSSSSLSTIRGSR